MTHTEISSYPSPLVVAGLEVGDVLIAPTFAVSPHDALEYERSAFVLGGGAEGLSGRPRGVPMSVGPGACAPGLVLSRALGSLLDALGRARRRLVVRSVGRLRHLATPVLGEVLTPVATVRFVTGVGQIEPHVTLAVELRRRGDRVLARFEVGVQFAAATVHVVEDETQLVA